MTRDEYGALTGLGLKAREKRLGTPRVTFFTGSRHSLEEALEQAAPATECTCTGSTQEIGGIPWGEGEEW